MAVNHRPFQKRQGSRYSQFQEVEKPALRALPATRYEFAQFKHLMVPPDYHLRLGQHYYSVPYTLVGQDVFCRYTTNTIEVLYQNQRVASRPISYEKDKKTTCSEHMPKAHRQYIEWTPELFWRGLRIRGMQCIILLRRLLPAHPILNNAANFILV